MTKFPSAADLRQALKLTEKIEELQNELNALLGSESSVASAPKPRKGKRGPRQMSPEAREKIAAAQRKRWAKSKRDKKTTAAEG